MMNTEELVESIDLKNYRLSDDSIKAVKKLVHATLEHLLDKISLEEILLKKYQAQLDAYMMKQYPDLSNRLNQMALDLKDNYNKFDKKLSHLIIREQKVAKSNSIYEDVYKMRDEMKEIKTLNEELSKKIKKAFS